MSEKNDPKPDGAPSPIGEISQEPSAFEAFLDANQKKLVIVGIILILGLVGYVIVDGLRKKADRDAAGVVSAARTVPELEAAAKDLEGKNAGGTALVFKSQLLWQDQQQQEAIKTLEEFVSKYPEHPALGNAYTSLGSYYRQTGNVDKAKEAYTSASETTSSASSLALLSLGDIALSEGDDDTAEKFYNRVISDHEPHLQVKGMAQQRLKLIGVNAPTEALPEPPKPDVPDIPTTTSTPFTIPPIPDALKRPDPAPQPAPNPAEVPPVEAPEKPAPPIQPEESETSETPPE